MTFHDLYTAWDTEKRQTLKPTSYSTYAILLEKHILPRLGDKEDITEEDVEQFRQDLTVVGNSPKTVADCIGVIFSICRYGAKQKLWPMPTWNTKRHVANKRKELRPLNLDEQKTLIGQVVKEPTPRNIAVYLALTTGISSGELCNLHWQDIDFKARVLHIRGIIQSYYDIDTDTKTKRWMVSKESQTEARDIPLAAAQLAFLQAEVGKHLPENYIFSNNVKPAEARSVRQYVSGLFNLLGIKNHQYKDLHHTFALQCIQTGCDIFTLATLLGFKSISNCASQYGSFYKRTPRPAMERLMNSLES